MARRLAMMRLAMGLALLLAGCSPCPENWSSKDVCLTGPVQVTDLRSLNEARDWQYGDGKTLNATWESGVKSVLGQMSKADTIRVIREAGFACTYGGSDKEHANTTVICSRSFATRGCQMDWEITSTADTGAVDGSFRRDCVGTDDDWPDKVISEMDSQLTPVMPP